MVLPTVPFKITLLHSDTRKLYMLINPEHKNVLVFHQNDFNDIFYSADVAATILDLISDNIKAYLTLFKSIEKN